VARLFFFLQGELKTRPYEAAAIPANEKADP
jgi:hypothetical protein